MAAGSNHPDVRVLHSILLVLIICIGIAPMALCRNVPEEHFPKRVHQLPGEFARMLAHVEEMAVPAVKSFQCPNGDIIDCVKIEDQATFKNNPELSKSAPKVPSAPSSPSQHDNHSDWTQQYMATDVCDEGTVPILRKTIDDYQRHPTLRNALHKYHHAKDNKLNKHKNNTTAASPIVSSAPHHEWASVYKYTQNHGVYSVLNVWQPFVEDAIGFSLSQVWVISNPSSGTGTQTLEAGWHVDPWIYNGAKQTRLFVYWTADNYQTTGCYNLQCTGFVQTNNRVLLGGVLPVPISKMGGKQTELRISIFKDPSGGDWWLMVNGQHVGYWPKSLYANAGSSGLQTQSDYVGYGGEIYTEIADRHTKTHMGSGKFASSGYGRAAYQADCSYVSVDEYRQYSSDIQNLDYGGNSNAACYTIAPGKRGTPYEAYFFFGGPGGSNKKCKLVV